MTAETIYNALNQALNDNNQINLWSASSDPALIPLLGVLDSLGIASNYVVSDVELTKGIDSVFLGGGAMFGQPGDPLGMRFSVVVRLNWTSDGTASGRFVLSLSIRDPDMLFSNFFNQVTLPDCQAVAQNTPTLEWTPSFLIGLRIGAPVFTAVSDTPDGSLTFSGLLYEAAAFASFADFLAPWPLSLSGRLTMPSDWCSPPVMDLAATASGGASLPVGAAPVIGGPSGFAISGLGLQLVIRTDLDADDWLRTAFSVANLVGRMTLGDGATGLAANLTTQVMTSSREWKLTATFDEDKGSIVRGIKQLEQIFGLGSLPIPDNFPLISLFHFKQVELYFSDPGLNHSPSSLRSMAVTIGSKQDWTPPIPFTVVHDVGVRWTWAVTEVGSSPVSSISGDVFGSFRFGGDQKKVDFDVNIALPEILINGDMRSGDTIPIGQAFDYFFDAPGPDVGTQTANVVALGFFADPTAQVYSANTEIVFYDPAGEPSVDQGWPINLIVTTIRLTELKFWIDAQGGRIGGGISAEFAFDSDIAPDDYEAARLIIAASYPMQDPETQLGWKFEGHLREGTSIDLIVLAGKFLDISPLPTYLPSLSVDRLDAEFWTGSGSYQLGGTVSARWAPDIFNGANVQISGAVSVDIGRSANLPAEAPAQGRLSVSFAVNKISIEAAMDLGVAERTYLFKVFFDEIWLQAVTSWRGDESHRHQVVSIQLGGKTLGDVLEYLVNLAAPTLGFSLGPPWDLLKRIELDRFVLTLDPEENIVEFVYRADVDLGFTSLSSIGVRYTKAGQGKVDLILEGSILGQSYTGEDALAWDVVNDPPPPVPGTGDALVDLSYLGIGQRIALNNPPASVGGTLALMRQAMVPVENPDDLPLSGPIIGYAADSQWLIGLDVKLLGGAIDFGLIFNDPIIYGLSLGLNGEKVGTLSGLKFEILYKKITDDIGMFRVELRLPDAFRTFTIGVATVTLGTVAVEIYTNGDFKVDFGFPHNQNFDESFSVQAYVFIGRGGFYLGVLHGATSSRVPKIANGNFSPVIELGVGLALGVGRELNEGMFGGGAYVEIQVIFEGVLSWFNPTSAGTPPATYFRADGIVALHGKIYGYVDFKVIKVSITVEAYAQISATYESYQPVELTLSASVSAEATVKVLFVNVSFSYDMEIEMDFTLGDASQTPWILAADQSGDHTQASSARSGTGGRRIGQASPAIRARKRPAHRRRILARDHLCRSLTADSQAQFDGVWGWDPTKKVFPNEEVKTAFLHLLPVISVGDMAIDWNEGAADGADGAAYRAAFVLTADTGVSAGETAFADMTKRSARAHGQSRDEDDLDALTPDLWVELILLYSLYSIPGGPIDRNGKLSIGQTDLLADVLTDRGSTDIGFAYDNLAILFGGNLHLAITGGSAELPEITGMTAPLPPGMSWDGAPSGYVDFTDVNKVGPWYEWGIAEAMSAYLPVGGQAGARPAEDDPANYESYPKFMFRDYCLMIAKAAVEEVKGLYAETAVTISDDQQTLADTAHDFDSATVTYTLRAGDTVDSVAAALGATPSELLFFTPNLAAQLAAAPVGSDLQITFGVSPEDLADSNSTTPIALSTLELGNVQHQVATGETLDAIASLFNLTTPTLLFQVSGIDTGLGAAPDLLRDDSMFDMPAEQWAGGPDTALRAAASAFARYALGNSGIDNPTVADPASWYAQAVFNLNAVALKDVAPAAALTDELPPGLSLLAPADFNNVDQTTPYLTIAGDTLMRIGLMLVFEQVYPTTTPSSMPEWPGFRDGVTETSPGIYNLPAFDDVTVTPGETVESVARRMIIPATWSAANQTWSYDWVAVLNWAGPADILLPLAVTPVPGAQANADEGAALTFEVLFEKFGLPAATAADRLMAVPGLFAEGTVLSVTHAPVLSVATIIDRIRGGERITRIVNQASRSLMAGLRVPGLKDEEGHTVPDKANLQPLYDLTGQQFSLDVDTDPARADDPALTLTVSSETSWVTLHEAGTLDAPPGGLLVQDPALIAANRRMALGGVAGPGVILASPEVDDLTYIYTNQQIIDMGPALSMSVSFASGPQTADIFGQAPRTYGLTHRIELQTPSQLPIPGMAGAPISAQPSLWTFPTALLTRAEAGVVNPYEILSARVGGAAGDEADAIMSSTWATLLRLGVKQVDDRRDLAVLQTVSEADRALILSLIDWFAAGDRTGTYGQLIIAPAPDAGATDGLAVFSGAPSGTFLLKSNLSTDSRPSMAFGAARTARAVDDETYFAALSDLSAFLNLLWEGAVVAGSGFYLGMATDLPASAFDDQGVATLELLVIANSQQAPAPTGRPLLPFNNCALIAPGLDPAARTLFVEDHSGEDLIGQALAPPGNYGFSFDMIAPQNTPLTGDDLLAHQMFSLLNVSAAGPVFTMPPSGMPATPESVAEGAEPKWQKQRRLRRRKGIDDDPRKNWRFGQVIPFYRFAPPSSLPTAEGLPQADNDPYRGFGRRAAITDAVVDFQFGDVLGNWSAVGGGAGASFDIPTGYTDPLIGVGDWPGIASSYVVQKQGNDISLEIVLSPRPSTAAPTPSQPGGAAAVGAEKQAEAFAKSYYQLGQNVTADVTTTLAPDAPIAFDSALLWRFAAASYVFSAAAADCSDQKLAGDQSLADALGAVNARVVETAIANAPLPVTALFDDQRLTVPAFAPFATQGIIQTLADAPRPTGWPTPTATAILSNPMNGDLPFRNGATLALPVDRSLNTGDGSGSLFDLAALWSVQVGDLAEQNQTAEVLQPGFVFRVEVDEGVFIEVTVNDDPEYAIILTFSDAVDAYLAEGVNVTAAGLAEKNQKPGRIFKPNMTLNSNQWLTHPGETLATNGSGQDQTALAPENIATPDLFDAGALVHLGVFGDGSGISPAAGQSIQDFAAAYDLTVELLLQANLDVVLPPDTAMIAPGLSARPQDPLGLRTPYSISAADSLTVVAGRFQWRGGDPTTALCTVNADMPSVFTGGIFLTITVDGTPVVVETPAIGASIAEVLALVQQDKPDATIGDIAASLGSTANILNAGGLLICGPASLPSPATPQAITDNYGVAASAYALANQALAGIVAREQTVFAPGSNIPLTTRAAETFNSLVVAFSEQGIQTDAASIADDQRNAATLIFAADAAALLPPASTQVSVPVAETGPFPGPLFPLSVSVTIARPAALVNGQFTGGAADVVRLATSAIPAPQSDADEGPNGGLTYNAFLEAMATAYPNLRFAVGRSTTDGADLWAVDFGATGISNVTLEGTVATPGQSDLQPRFFALAPLYSTLVTRSDVKIQNLSPDGTLSPAEVSTDFQAVDVQPWASRFLADFDRMLSAAYASRCYASGMTDQVAALLESKTALMAEIPAGLLPVFDIDGQVGLASAQRALRQQLGVSLARAFGIATAIQFDKTTVSPWDDPANGLAPAAFSGEFSPTTAPEAAQDWTLTSAKVALTDDEPFVNTLMTVANEAAHSVIRTTLAYGASDLEYDIHGQGLPDGYVTSHWLSFTPPLIGANRPPAMHSDLGEVAVPVPLRNFPSLPVISGQSAAPTSVAEGAPRQRPGGMARSEAGTIPVAAMPDWTHSFAYSHEHAEQDEVILTLSYNQQADAPFTRFAVGITDLFTALTRYIAVADDLWAILTALEDPDAEITPAVRNAITTFSTLSAEIAALWSARIIQTDPRLTQTAVGMGEDDTNFERTFGFTARVHDGIGPDNIPVVDAFSLTSLQALPGPNGAWPEVRVRDVNGVEILLIAEPPAGASRRYSVPDDNIVPFEWPQFRLSWTGLNAARWQDAVGALQVRRNQNLLGPDGPATTDPFVFETNLVEAPGLIAPLNVWANRTPLTGTPGPNYIQSALQAAFDALFPEGGAQSTAPLLTIGVAYGYELAIDPLDSAGSYISPRPVYTYPNQSLSASTAPEIARAVQFWLDAAKPELTRGELIFSLTLYSTLSDEKRPLMQIDRLFLPLAPMAV